MGKRQFRIGELAAALGVERYVVRFWEKEFNLAAFRSEGGQRFYTNDDLITFTYIKDLLYNEGYTLAGARLQLQQRKQPTPGLLELRHNPAQEIAAHRDIIPARRKALKRKNPIQRKQCSSCKDNERLQKDLETLSVKLHGLKKQLGSEASDS